MKATLILSAVTTALAVLVVILVRVIRKQKKENSRISEELEAQQKNLLYLYRHAEEIAEVDRDRNRTDREIGEAKSDEEVLDIINSVIAVNNSRVRDNKKN